MTKVWLVIRTKPSLAVLGVFNSRPKADFCAFSCPTACIIEEWNVA
jgi:hypothetical protein